VPRKAYAWPLSGRACALRAALPASVGVGLAIGAPSVVRPLGAGRPSGLSAPWADAWVVSPAVFAIDCEKIRVLKAGNGFPVKGEMLELFNMVSIEVVAAAARLSDGACRGGDCANNESQVEGIGIVMLEVKFKEHHRTIRCESDLSYNIFVNQERERKE